ncbi:MAG: histidinol-phosphatase HisJ family protein [Peptococcaceae bacterium]|nr:histidinol-phosphatase HisJ family protein [Peptococcaceae bacterium]
MLTDYHLHIERGPYSLDWLQRFINQGLAEGIGEFGFSEHCYRFTQAGHLLDNAWSAPRCTQDIADYIRLITAAKASGLPVKLGIEVDYIPGKESEIGEFLARYPFDFVIGSVHWLDDWGFDLEETLPRWQKADIDAVYTRYFGVIHKAAQSGLFDILGHLDLVKIYGFRPQQDLTDLYRQTCAIIAASGCAIEVSTAGLRKKVGEIYPHPALLSLCRSYDIPITLSSDAHAPEQVGENFMQAVKLITDTGYTSLTTFANRVPKSVPLHAQG